MSSWVQLLLVALAACLRFAAAEVSPRPAETVCDVITHRPGRGLCAPASSNSYCSRYCMWGGRRTRRSPFGGHEPGNFTAGCSTWLNDAVPDVEPTQFIFMSGHKTLKSTV